MSREHSWFAVAFSLLVLASAAPAAATTADGVEFVDVETPGAVAHGENLTVVVTVANHGETHRSATVQVRSNRSSRQWESSATVLPDESGRVVVNVPTGELDQGYHRLTVTAGGESRTVTVLVGDIPRREDRRVREATVQAGTQSQLAIQSSLEGSVVVEAYLPGGVTAGRIQVSNASVFTDRRTDDGRVVILYDASRPRVNATVSVSSDRVGQTVPVVWSFSSSRTTESVVVMVSVEEPPQRSPLAPYRTDGTVRTSGLLRAIEDWQSGELETRTLRRAINEWEQA